MADSSARAPAAPATPPPPAPALQVDVDDSATDDASSIDERLSNYTASLTSSVVDYPVEYGRSYHAYRPGSYKFPNDAVEKHEMDRLELAHTMMVRAMGNVLYKAPLQENKVQRILDIGTGNGIWAIEMGDSFPNAEVLGIDLSAVVPEWVPPNVKFEIDDIEDAWVGHKKYDFIFCRYMGASIKDWPNLMKNIHDHLAPGGWAEFQDVNTTFYSEDGTYSEDSATSKWMTAFMAACSATGRDPSVGPKLEGWVRDAQFQHIVADKIKAPLGPWAKDTWYKDLGMMNLILTLDGLEALSLKLFAEMLVQTQAEIMVQLAAVRKELKSTSFHAMFDIHVVYGQKPLESVA